MSQLIDWQCPADGCEYRVEGFRDDDPQKCPKCGAELVPFSFKQNGQKWRWNDTGFDRM